MSTHPAPRAAHPAPRAPRVRTVQVRLLRRLTLVVLVAAGLTACGTSPTPPEESRAQTPVPSPPAAPPDEPTAAALPEVPVRSADLGPVVHPTAPVSLSIPALAIEVPIDPVGVQADGQMEIPPLAERAGWYRFGAAPGDPTGTSVVAAHVDSVASAGLGPFAQLTDLTGGELVEVRLEDGTVRQYTVNAVTESAKTDVIWQDVFTRDGSPRLALITCGGAFDGEARRYLDNIIVTAVPVGG